MLQAFILGFRRFVFLGTGPSTYNDQILDPMVLSDTRPHGALKTGTLIRMHHHGIRSCVARGQQVTTAMTSEQHALSFMRKSRVAAITKVVGSMEG